MCGGMVTFCKCIFYSQNAFRSNAIQSINGGMPIWQKEISGQTFLQICMVSMLYENLIAHPILDRKPRSRGHGLESRQRTSFNINLL